MFSLKINFICMHPNLSGAYKATRLLAEALVRRGHRVQLVYLCDIAWPPLTQPRRVLRRLRDVWQAKRHMAHHFDSSTATLVPVHGSKITASDAPDADASIAIMWETREFIESWPKSKGVKAFLVQGDERLREEGDMSRIDAVHCWPGLRLAVSSAVQLMLKERFSIEDAVLMPNGVEECLINAPARDRGNPPTVGLTYGRSELKGAAVAFEAIRLAQQKVPNLRTIAFGARPVHWQHQPPEPFEFHLAPRQETLPATYRRADCWLLPSTSEGFGMPGLEAAASRCPVIATRCGGPADYIRDGVSGYMVDIGDAANMGRRLVDILTCDAERWKSMSAASHEIASQFTWDRSACILEQAIQRATDGE